MYQKPTALHFWKLGKTGSVYGHARENKQMESKYFKKYPLENMQLSNSDFLNIYILNTFLTTVYFVRCLVDEESLHLVENPSHLLQIDAKVTSNSN